jgi:2-oxoisovalerate dehydrogenase E1 component
LAELLGRQGALCGGRGGTQHLRRGRFFSTGVQGEAAALATGFAWALRQKGEPGIAVAVLGDGTLGEGALYEALGFAAWRDVPVLFFLEYNGWAMSTEAKDVERGDLAKRIEGFGVPFARTSDQDPVALAEHLRQVVECVRAGHPFFQVVDTRRLGAHSKGDDTRPATVIERLRREDPLSFWISEQPSVAALYADARVAVQGLVREVEARASLDPTPGSAWPRPPGALASTALLAQQTSASNEFMVDRVRAALSDLLERDRHAILLGEDIADPHGGAFRATRGLSTGFPQQVAATPISESAIVGVATGLAMGGVPAVAELMFADFATLAVDPLVNYAAKLHYVYGQPRCPLIVRLASGGGRGYGPTHSQSLETLFLGVPGLRVVSLSARHEPSALLAAILDGGAPTVLVEHKRVYADAPRPEPPLDCELHSVSASGGDLPPLVYLPADGRAGDVTLVTHGGMLDVAEIAMRELLVADELRFELIVLTQLWPLLCHEIAASVSRTGRLCVLEESPAPYGVGSAVIAAVAESARRPFQARALGAVPVPIPSVRSLEECVLPNSASLVQSIRQLVRHYPGES